MRGRLGNGGCGTARRASLGRGYLARVFLFFRNHAVTRQLSLQYVAFLTFDSNTVPHVAQVTRQPTMTRS